MNKWKDVPINRWMFGRRMDGKKVGLMEKRKDDCKEGRKDELMKGCKGGWMDG